MILTDQMCMDLAKVYLVRLKGVLPEEINECAEELKRVGERWARMVLTGDDDED